MKLKKLLSTLSVMMLTFSFSINNSATIHADDTNTWNFSYTGQMQTFTAPYSGTYKLEVWGASGGKGSDSASSSDDGGKGGYAYGEVNAVKGQILYVYVGGMGIYTTSITTGGGWNGGGNSYYAGTGGGATDIRTSSGPCLSPTGLNTRILVAGGGGGSCDNYIGGYGGGLVGGPGISSNGKNISGGGQSSGGSSGGSFGFGGSQYVSNGQLYNGGGGGGGWYGGGSNNGLYIQNNSGGGGSSYIGGVLKGTTTAGVNSGNGYARITSTATYATGIVISKRADSLEVGKTDKLTALVTPSRASVKTVKWTSSDPSVVTVDDNGNITAVKAGTAIITATVQDGRNLHGQCRVEVTN